MVHALEEIWRVLAPAGLLLDIRPFEMGCPLHIYAGNRWRLAGQVDESPGFAIDLAANEALAQMARRGHFASERSGSFVFAMYWDKLEELLAHAAERWGDQVIIPEEVIVRARELMPSSRPRMAVRLNRHLIIGRYRKMLSGAQRATV